MAAACAVTAGCGDGVSGRTRRAAIVGPGYGLAKCPSIVHGSRTASTSGTSSAANPRYSVSRPNVAERVQMVTDPKRIGARCGGGQVLARGKTLATHEN